MAHDQIHYDDLNGKIFTASPAELRELARRIREAVPKAPTEGIKQSLAAHAFQLAQVAEQLDRDDGADASVRQANIERYTRLLAGALDESTRNTVEALLAEENAAQPTSMQ